MASTRIIRHRILVRLVVAATAVIALLWTNEIFDLPHLFLGAPSTPVNWRESLLETVVVVPIFAALHVCIRRLLARLSQLEGMLSICSGCKKVRDEAGAWSPVETYIHQHAPVDFSHGICPECLARLYPEMAAKSGSDGSVGVHPSEAP